MCTIALFITLNGVRICLQFHISVFSSGFFSFLWYSDWCCCWWWWYCYCCCCCILFIWNAFLFLFVFVASLSHQERTKCVCVCFFVVFHSSAFNCVIACSFAHCYYWEQQLKWHVEQIFWCLLFNLQREPAQINQHFEKYTQGKKRRRNLLRFKLYKHQVVDE